ncbi:facilitator of iron transport 3-like [Drosophila rhopaloa]|uniref:SAP domain-containing protein n=1 Tax=Drosophila rhopaloa TaxID=1041015 RepID=A0ABM5JG26_DRORH|nr:facilitator of iron transport 3-like [Drosophila rhopaloa]
MDINISEVTVIQLKKWLELLNLSTKGTKSELFARLCSVPEEIRGRAPENLVEQAELENVDENRTLVATEITEAEEAKMRFNRTSNGETAEAAETKMRFGRTSNGETAEAAETKLRFSKTTAAETAAAETTAAETTAAETTAAETTAAETTATETATAETAVAEKAVAEKAVAEKAETTAGRGSAVYDEIIRI